MEEDFRDDQKNAVPRTKIKTNIPIWIESFHSFCLMQFLSEQVGYLGYLYRFGYDNSPHCPRDLNIAEDHITSYFKTRKLMFRRPNRKQQQGRI